MTKWNVYYNLYNSNHKKRSMKKKRMILECKNSNKIPEWIKVMVISSSTNNHNGNTLYRMIQKCDSDEKTDTHTHTD